MQPGERLLAGVFEVGVVGRLDLLHQLIMRGQEGLSVGGQRRGEGQGG